MRSMAHLHPSPLAFSQREPLSGLEDWQLVVELLPPPDPDLDIYTPKELAKALGNVSIHSIRSHIRDVCGKDRSHIRLTRHDAIRVIKRYCCIGRRRHTRDALLALVEQKRALTASIPTN